MKEARLKEASDEPGNMTERTLIEEWAARRDVEVMYSPKWMGARVSCSAREMTVDTAPRKRGDVTVLPPKKVWSIVVEVTAAMAEAIPRVIENCNEMNE